MTLSRDIQAVGAIWIREFKIFQREKSRVVSAMATPLLWLTLVGSGFSRTIDESALGGVSYIAFLFPGLVVQTILFGTVFYGLYIIWDRKLDVLKEILVAPVSRTAIFFGKVVGGSTEAILQSLVILTVGIFLVDPPILGLLGSLVIVLLLAIGFVSVGLTIGSFFESLEGFQTIVTFLIFPAFFLSGALFPFDNLPPALRPLALANPATYGVDALRGLLVGVGHFPLALDVAVLVGFDVVMILVGTWAFSRMR